MRRNPLDGVQKRDSFEGLFTVLIKGTSPWHYVLLLTMMFLVATFEVTVYVNDVPSRHS